MSAYWKIPLQALVLLVGVSGFPVLHIHAAATDLRQPYRSGDVRAGPQAREYLALEQQFGEATASRSAAAGVMNRARAAGDSPQLAAAGEQFKVSEAEVSFATRAKALQLVRTSRNDVSYNDVNYGLSDLHHDAHAGRLGGAADRCHSRGSHVDGCR